MRLLLIPVGCPSETMGLIYELDQRRERKNLDQDEVIKKKVTPNKCSLTPVHLEM